MHVPTVAVCNSPKVGSKSGNERDRSDRTGTESGNLEGWLILVTAAGVKLGSALLVKGIPSSCGKVNSNSCGPLSRKPPPAPLPQGGTPYSISPGPTDLTTLLLCFMISPLSWKPWHGPGFQIFPFLLFLPYLLFTLKLFPFLGFYKRLQRNRLGITSMGSYVVDINFEVT